jgi:hypothetical protein
MGSILTTVLGWTKLPQWALELMAVAGAALLTVWVHHHLVDEGKDAEIVALKTAATVASAQNAAKTTVAENNRANEDTLTTQFVDSHPIAPVSLCNETGASPVPSAKTVSGQSSASPGAVQQVSAGSDRVQPVQHPDISSLLSVLAERADAVSSELRARQAVQP